MHAKINGRRRKNVRTSLDQVEGLIEGDKDLINYITNFYKNLFGLPKVSSISLHIENPQKFPTGAADKLTAEFFLEEIKKWFMIWLVINHLGLIVSLPNSINIFWSW